MQHINNKRKIIKRNDNRKVGKIETSEPVIEIKKKNELYIEEKEKEIKNNNKKEILNKEEKI